MYIRVKNTVHRNLNQLINIKKYESEVIIMFLNETSNMIYDGMLLSETYYGKIDEMTRCESYIQEMKQDLLSGKNPNKSPAKTHFEETIASLFGFEKVYFSIIADERYANGFTVPFFCNTNTLVSDSFFDLVKTPKGVKFKNPKGKILYVYSYNYVIRNFTPEENMSIFMHEVGHNFFLVKEQVNYCKVNRGIELTLSALEYLKETGYSSDSFKETTAFLLDVGKEIDNMSESVYKEYQKLLSDKTQRKIIKKYEREHNGISGFFFASIKVLRSVISSILKVPVAPVMTLFLPLIMLSYRSNVNLKRIKKDNKRNQNYNAEKFSDNFALSYGYSTNQVQLFSNLEKWSSKNNIDDKIPVLRVTNYWFESISNLLFAFSDEHPDCPRRVKFALEKVKYELNNNKDELSPKQIAELESQVERIESILKDLPYYKKGFNTIFNKYWNIKDKAAINDITSGEIFDFDKTLIKDNIKSESINLDNLFTEDCDQIIDKYLNENDKLIMDVIDNIYD